MRVGGVDLSGELWGEITQTNAEKRVRGLACADDLLSNALGRIDRDRKTEPTAGCRADECVHPDHLSGRVDQRSTAVARVHRCIRLDVGDPLSFSGGAANRTDDPSCDGVVQSIGVADGDGPFPRAQLVRVAKGGHRQLFGDHLHHGHIGEVVASKNLAGEAAPVRQCDGHFVRATHHMLIGEDQPVGSGDEPRSLALLALG